MKLSDFKTHDRTNTCFSLRLKLNNEGWERLYFFNEDWLSRDRDLNKNRRKCILGIANTWAQQ